MFALDIETSGLPAILKRINNPYKEPSNLRAYDSSRMMSIAYAFFGADDASIDIKEEYIKIDAICPVNEQISQLCQNGISIDNLASKLSSHICDCEYILGHNVLFDIHILASEFSRAGYNELCNVLMSKVRNNRYICTLALARHSCVISHKMSLADLHSKLFPCPVLPGHGANSIKHDASYHNAAYDLHATLQLYYYFRKPKLPSRIQAFIAENVVCQQLSDAEITHSYTLYTDNKRDIEKLSKFACRIDKSDGGKYTIYMSGNYDPRLLNGFATYPGKDVICNIAGCNYRISAPVHKKPIVFNLNCQLCNQRFSAYSTKHCVCDSCFDSLIERMRNIIGEISKLEKSELVPIKYLKNQISVKSKRMEISGAIVRLSSASKRFYCCKLAADIYIASKVWLIYYIRIGTANV